MLVVKEALLYFGRHFSDRIEMPVLADTLGTSLGCLVFSFDLIRGITPLQALQEHRLNRLFAALTDQPRQNLARAIGCKSVEPCKPEVAQRHSGYLVGGTSPFGFRKDVPVYAEATIFDLPRILINGGRRGFLVGIEPSVLSQVLGAQAVSCALSQNRGS